MTLRSHLARDAARLLGLRAPLREQYVAQVLLAEASDSRAPPVARHPPSSGCLDLAPHHWVGGTVPQVRPVMRELS